MTIWKTWVLALTAIIATCAVYGAPVRAQQDAGTVLITGANRGLGFEFTQQYAAKGWTVIATARRPDEADDLQALAAANDNLTIEQLDVLDHAAIDALAEKYRDTPIDVLLNNAGLAGYPSPGQMLGTLDYEEMALFFATNAVGPLKMAEAFLPHVKASAQKKIIALSSSAGSFAGNGSGIPGLYHYKISKAALNMAYTQLARDVAGDGVIVTLVSPGQVDTTGALAGMQIPGLVDIEISIAGLIGIIDGLTADQSGAFIRYNGEVLEY